MAHDDDDEREAWDAPEDDRDTDLPQERDLDPDASEDDLATDACPHCGHEIIHGAARCPGCGQYTTSESAPGRNPPWLAAIALLVALALLAWALRG